MSNRRLEALLESAAWQTLLAVAIPLIVGVLSGTFVFELTSQGAIAWDDFYKAKSFYGLLVVGAISYFYQRAAYDYARNVEKFLDDDYCRAYMRSKCLPEAAERYKELIRSGEKSELTAAMREFEKILK